MENTLTCVYCGMTYPEGAPPHGSQILTDHIKICEKHRDALHIIAHMGISGLSWQHDFEKCVNIAKEALEI